ncbi:hypothetical protein KL86DYS1_31590 [uncultured Dysgonomonas sp.]|uniref:Uncharacterized protein n=1 Tax=uncultured Dysgonomonas sp. TaxID=206096 RepID=A0A212K5Y8_9BACT|nr:hypothetical protein KL86DYS1_31590 [uncultured Dysgonomonas sp.]
MNKYSYNARTRFRQIKGLFSFCEMKSDTYITNIIFNIIKQQYIVLKRHHSVRLNKNKDFKK